MTERAAAIQGLRDLADWLEKTPAAPMIWSLGISAFPDDNADPVAVLKALKAEIGEPRRNDNWLFADKEFGPVVYRLAIDLGRPQRPDHEAAFLRLVQQVITEAADEAREAAHQGGE